MDRKSKALILLSVVAVAAILGSMVLPTYALGDEERNRGLPPPWLDDLTDEQREAIEQKVQEMREAGASREEIRAEINAMLEEWGVEVPEFHGPTPPWLGNLTDEQRAEIDQIVQDMKEAGATREEIKAAVDAKLEEWGIEVPECPHPCAQGMHPRMHRRMRHIATTEDSEQ